MNTNERFSKQNYENDFEKLEMIKEKYKNGVPEKIVEKLADIIRKNRERVE